MPTDDRKPPPDELDRLMRADLLRRAQDLSHQAQRLLDHIDRRKSGDRRANRSRRGIGDRRRP